MKESLFSSKSVILKAISNAKRLEILHYLHKEEASVGTLEDLVKLSQSALSQHLAVLRRANVVKTRRSAQTIYYSINSNIVENILDIFSL
jgi:DNA-binding transcriptional ArsR family regulator